jgi:hypothetical protein
MILPEIGEYLTHRVRLKVLQLENFDLPGFIPYLVFKDEFAILLEFTDYLYLRSSGVYLRVF